MKKRILITAGFLFVAAAIAGIIRLNALLPIATGYHAKILCSAVFISDRSPEEVIRRELNFSLVKFVRTHVDTVRKTVTSRLLWQTSVATYRNGYGTLLLPGTSGAGDRRPPFPKVPPPSYDPDTLPWPLGNRLPDVPGNGKQARLEPVIRRLMMQHAYGGDPYAFIVLHRGVPLAEEYHHSFGPSTRFPGWSVAKSFISTLAGIMVAEGRLDPDRPAAIPGWANDERKNITLKDLLQMQSGLEWNEDYGTASDVTKMLFTANDFAAYTASKPPECAAGTRWQYASGIPNIVTLLMRQSFGNDSAYLSYPCSRLFYPIGMTCALFETDAAGNIAGSSYLFATARDFARFGLLWLNRGTFMGQRIVPEEWVRFATTPAPHSGGNYGASFWLNRGGRYPAAPPDMFFCIGVDGQRIFIIPSRDLVIVVLGSSREPDHALDFNLLLADILRTLPA